MASINVLETTVYPLRRPITAEATVAEVPVTSTCIAGRTRNCARRGKNDLENLKIDPIQNRGLEPEIGNGGSYRTIARETSSPSSLAGGEVNSVTAVGSTSW